MKTIIMALAILLVGTASFAQVKKKAHKKHHHHSTAAKMYACPMHPNMVSKKPGKCPKCGMMMDEKMKNGKIMADKKMDHEKM